MIDPRRSTARHRPLISLGDAIRAVDRLEATGSAALDIADLLGVRDLLDATASEEKRYVLDAPRIATEARVPEPETVMVIPPAKPIPVTRQVLSSTLTEVPGGVFEGIRSEPLPRQVSTAAAPPPIEPLFRPGWARAVLSAVLSTAGDAGEIDVDALVPRIATRSQIDHLPRLPRPTMRRGAQLLLDRGPALTPFGADQDWLAAQVRRVGGSDRVQVVEFFSAPNREGPIDATGRPITYATPASGTPVLVMTDLGIGRPPGWTDWATPEEWLEYALLIRKAGCPLFVLVPYPRRRWPRALADRLSILPFDRATAVSTVRRLTRIRQAGMR